MKIFLTCAIFVFLIFAFGCSFFKSVAYESAYQTYRSDANDKYLKGEKTNYMDRDGNIVGQTTGKTEDSFSTQKAEDARKQGKLKMNYK